MNPIYINYGTKIKEMTYDLMTKANIKASLSPYMTVGIKPNLVSASEAYHGATTHPEVVEGIIEYLKEYGILNIKIMESSWVGEKTARAFKKCSYLELAEKYNAALIDLKTVKTREVNTNRGEIITICEMVETVDFLINVPVLKAHCQTNLTCCLKNLKGCIPDHEKRRFHALGLHNPIALLAAIIKPDLHIVDSICGDLTFEEGGNPVQSNRILLGFDGVQMDSYCAGLLGYHIDEIDYIPLAKDYGAGSIYKGEEIIELNAHRKPGVSMNGSPLAKSYESYILQDQACSACYASLIFALNKIGKPKLNPLKPIQIGQGFKNKDHLPGIGIGNCTKGCQTHIPGCPPKAVDIVDVLKGLL